MGVCEQQRRRPACTSVQSDQCFVIRLLEGIIFQLAISEIPMFRLVYVADETALSLALSEVPETGFVASRSIFIQCL